ncbi:MAG: type II toxin-antitoxin system VapC family toxin [Myxococcota bacterium]
MSFLVDTNVISELRKGPRADAGVRAWMAATPASSLWTSVLVLGELRRGVEAIRRRDPSSAESLSRWLEAQADALRDRTLAVDADVADRWGRLDVPVPLPTVDGLLAATAIVHDLTLVTRNTRDVARSGARVLNPFSGPT